MTAASSPAGEAEVKAAKEQLMAEQKMYAVKLKDGSWAQFFGQPYLAASRDEAIIHRLGLRLEVQQGARVVPVRLVEDPDG